jgi:hypothetical protein
VAHHVTPAIGAGQIPETGAVLALVRTTPETASILLGNWVCNQVGNQRIKSADDVEVMKTAVKFDGRRRGTARHLPQLMVVAFSSAVAVRYCLAAQRDEKNGFPLTAAMEWRKAAELLAPLTPMSDRCWREWERIMRLPRRLAGPIGACSAVDYGSPTPDTKAVPLVAVLNNAPLAAAA